MSEWLAGHVSDFDDDRRRIVSIEGREVVVLYNNGKFYAFDNYCLHMGGPVGEGVVMGKVEAVLSEDKRYMGERFSDDAVHLVCPWHGWEYDLETGEFAGDRRRRLRRYDVAVRGDEVYVGA